MAWEFGKTYTASAPGRLDVMGGIADYSGSRVLQMPILSETKVSILVTEGLGIQIYSVQEDGVFEAQWTDFQNKGEWLSYTAIRQKISSLPNGHWAGYVIGALLVFLKEENHLPLGGLKIEVDSGVPTGKGVSSSAALEVATLRAFTKVFGLELSGTRLPILAQMAENRVVGAPCGLMDQLASHLGQRGSLLPIVCRPDLVENLISIPKKIKFIGIDSGVRHAVTGASYTDVRTAAFMGYSIIAQELGAPVEALEKAQVNGLNPELPFGGYVTGLKPSEFFSRFEQKLPEKITGEKFLEFYKASPDSLTHIIPRMEYAVRNCTAHPVWENHRVEVFEALLKGLPQQDAHQQDFTLKQMGELFFQAHSSYSRCGLGNETTDLIVDMVRQTNGKGLYGAKITGGGSGGTVCVMAYGDEGEETLRGIHQRLQEITNQTLAWIE